MRRAGTIAGWCGALAGLMFANTRLIAGGCSDWRVGPLEHQPNVNGTDGAVHALSVWDPDGPGLLLPRLVAGGVFTSVQGTAARNVAWQDPLTGQWQALGTPTSSPFGDVRALTVFNDQLIVGSGTTWDHDHWSSGRWDGSQWQRLDVCSVDPAKSSNWVRALTVYNGGLMGGGNFSRWSLTPCSGTFGFGVLQWNAQAGNTWEFVPASNPTGLGVGAAPAYTARALTIWQGNLIAGGDFAGVPFGGDAYRGIASYDGNLWSGIGGGCDGDVFALAVYNGELIAAGNFADFGGQPRSRIARWNGSTWQPLGSGMDGDVLALTVYNGQLIAGGTFSLAGGQNCLNIAAWNGFNWQPIAGGINGPVECMTVHNNALIVGGDFTQAGGAGGVAANDLARWDGGVWSAFVGGRVDAVNAIATFGSRIVAAGNLRQYTSNMQANHIVSFDGRVLGSFGTGTNDAVNALMGFTNAQGKNELVAGGFFTMAGGAQVNRIARWVEDPVSGLPPPLWSPMGIGFNGGVNAIARFNGSTVAGGFFTASSNNLTPYNRIARWRDSTSAWEPMGTGFNGAVAALRSYSVSAMLVRVVAGGYFPGGVAAWTENTQVPSTPSWTVMGNGFDGPVLALELHNGSLYAAGAFTMSGTTTVNHIARWNTALNPDAWEPVGDGFDGNVTSLKSHNGVLYAGGDFAHADGAPANRLAAWNGSTWTEVQGGADAPVLALGVYHDELHAGGTFNTVRQGAIASRGYARYFITGVPWIYDQPDNDTVTCNQHAYFYSLPATGYGGLQFVWRRNGVPLNNGPTGTGSHILNRGPLLDILYPSEADEGMYDLVLTSDGCGSVTTTGAALDVIEACAPCPADATHDRVVNVDDLIAIILNWGPCPPLPPDYGYAPPCVADVTGNGVVDVDDLILVIIRWGGCA